MHLQLRENTLAANTWTAHFDVQVCLIHVSLFKVNHVRKLTMFENDVTNYAHNESSINISVHLP